MNFEPLENDEEFLHRHVGRLIAWHHQQQIDWDDFCRNLLFTIIVQPKKHWPPAMNLLPKDLASACLAGWNAFLDSTKYRPEIQPGLALGLSEEQDQLMKDSLEPVYRDALVALEHRCRS